MRVAFVTRRRASAVLALVVAVAGCSGSSITYRPPLIYSRADGGRLLLIGDGGSEWVREKADGTDIAKGTEDGWWPALDECKPK